MDVMTKQLFLKYYRKRGASQTSDGDADRITDIFPHLYGSSSIGLRGYFTIVRV
jgi:hypothetical protein